MTQGKVLWYNRAKGYGFIQDDFGQQIYFSQSSLIEPFRETDLDFGITVAFDLFITSIGLEASNVLIHQHV